MKLPYLLIALALAASPAHAAQKHAHAPAQPAQSTAAETAPQQAAPATAPAASNPNLPTPQAVPKPNPAPTGPGPTPPPPQIDAKSWVLMDYASGQILLGGNEDARVAPASITKVMTSYVVSAELSHGKNHLDDKVTISEKAWRSGGAGTDG
jgi:D-alanyl-D-alanine carboxypeptidase (penicillin-binding protein 5/6)